MADNLEIKILPTGHIKFKRGDKDYNKKMIEILSQLVDGDEEKIKELEDFFKGSEEVEIIMGSTIFCG